MVGNSHGTVEIVVDTAMGYWELGRPPRYYNIVYIYINYLSRDLESKNGPGTTCDEYAS